MASHDGLDHVGEHAVQVYFIRIDCGNNRLHFFIGHGAGGIIPDMKAILFQPLIRLNVLERLVLIDVTIGGEYVNLILILEAVNKIHDRPYGTTCFESRCIPVAKNKQFCFFRVQWIY